MRNIQSSSLDLSSFISFIPLFACVRVCWSVLFSSMPDAFCLTRHE